MMLCWIKLMEDTVWKTLMFCELYPKAGIKDVTKPDSLVPRQHQNSENTIILLHLQYRWYQGWNFFGSDQSSIYAHKF